jgi:hypothetical protein
VADLARLLEAIADAAARGGSDAALEICRACVSWLPVTGASITVMAGRNQQQPVCATGPGAAALDELQFALGEGPCVETFLTGVPVTVDDITTTVDARWPAFATAAARDTDARGMYVFPLRAGAGRLGVLDCYRDTPGRLTAQQMTGAAHAADAATRALLGLADGATVGDAETDGLLTGSTLARVEVHQATGMVMIQAGVGPAVALSKLRAFAFAQGRSLDDVARDVVARRLRFDEENR